MSPSIRGRLALPLVGVLAAGLSAVVVPSLSQAQPAQPGFQVENTSAQESNVSYGPISLPPAVGGSPARVNIFMPAVPMPCTNCYMTGAEVDMVFSDGRSANLDSGVMLHHLVVWNSGTDDATCGPDTPMGKLGERFFAAGNERTAGELPAGFGYLYGDAPVKADLDLMNHSDQPQMVYLKAKLHHVPASDESIKPVRPVWLDEENCRTSEYGIPAGQSNRVWTWNAGLTGRVVAAGGHLHDGGTKLDILNQTTGQDFCTSYAGYGTKAEYMGSLESMSTCIWDKIGTFSKGDIVAIDSYYDSPGAQTDVMGIALLYVYETDDLAGGTTPPAGAFATSMTGDPHSGHHQSH